MHSPNLDCMAGKGGSLYISFPETGRVQPSRQTLLTLVNMLDIPLWERNFPLLAEESAIVKLSY
jgi:hypothetical protein